MTLLALLFCAPAGAVTLDEAVDAATENSVQLKIVEEGTRAAASYRGQAWSLLSPKVQAQGGYFVNSQEIVLDTKAMVPPEFQDFFGDSEPIVVQPKHYWQGTLTVQQSLFSGEALPLLLGAYRNTDAARYHETAQRQKVEAGVARSYYGLLTARQGVEVAIAAEDTAKASLELAKRQVDAGVAPPRAVLQAELSVSQATRGVQSAREAVVRAEEAFHALTGLPRDSALELPPPVPAPASLEDAVAQARSSRPDVLSAEQQARAAKLQVRSNWLGWTPDITARYTAIYSENTGFAGDKTMWVAAVEGTWLLWDGGYRTAKAGEYAAQARQAELGVEFLQIQAEGDVRNAWETYHRAESALQAVEREQKLADESLVLAQRGFEAGTTTWLEVEQAQLYQRSAQLNGLVERMNRDMAAIDLQVAMGTYGR
jgi:outer membrane protein TolC